MSSQQQHQPRVQLSDDEWRKKLNPQEFDVLRRAGTERPFVGEYTDTKTVGLYRCRACGAELIRILHRHPHVEPVLMDHREDAGDGPKLKKPSPLRRAPSSPDSVASEGLSAIFLATPPEVSMELAPAMIAAGAKVIDLSGAFRLGTADRYKQWYKADHTQPALLAEAAYGLPEFCRSAISGARLISNPGCYPTAANLAIRPLVAAGVVDRAAGIICDGKSGISGAGRKASLKTSFCEVAENLSAYSVLPSAHPAPNHYCPCS